MENKKFTAWCKEASGLIRYGPDREAVSAELQAHLEDKYDALVATGMDPEGAAAKTLEAMGSPKDIAPQLAAIHRPWLGYLYSTMKFLGIALGFAAVFFCVTALVQQFTHWLQTEQGDMLAEHGESGYFCKPDVGVVTDGYHLRVSEAAVDPEESRLYFLLTVTWLPWDEEFSSQNDGWFWAKDSEGNYYDSINAARYEEGTRMCDFWSGGTIGVRVYSMGILGFDCDAKWVELHYDRDDPDAVLRIDLTGGGGT